MTRAPCRHLDPQRRAPLLAYAALPLTLFVALASALASVPLPWSLHWSWVPSLGVDLAFHVDGLAAQMLLLITGVGSLVFIYAAGYLAGTPGAGRVPVLLSLFLLAMIGAVTADNLLAAVRVLGNDQCPLLSAGRLQPRPGGEPQVGAAGPAGHRRRRAVSARRLPVAGRSGRHPVAAGADRGGAAPGR